MNILILDNMVNGVNIALRWNKAGHHCRLVLPPDKKTHMRISIGDGLVEKIERQEWQKSMNWADLVITTDNNKWLRELDIYRKKGFPILSPSFESAQLELIRDKGQQFFKKCGLKIIDYQMFSDYAKAKKYVMDTRGTYVSKPNGDRDKALSYLSHSAADMLYMLTRWQERNKDFGAFMLQEFVPGVEFAVAGWLGPKGFCQYIEESFEHKKFMNDDKGPNTGEMGTAIKYVEDSALAKEVLLPLERGLIQMGHTGSFNVNVIVDEDGVPRPLECTARLGWPANNIVQPLHPEPVEWMVDLLDGKDTFRPLTDHAIGVVLTIPEFPYSKLTKKEVSGVPIYNLDDENPYREFLAPCDVMHGKAPAMVDDELVLDKNLMVSSGDYLCVATGLGDTVREAQKEAYAAVDSLEVPDDLMYRTDIGARVKKALPELQDRGFALDWRW
jgi:phosphoribosylamine--glycine ligase